MTDKAEIPPHNRRVAGADLAVGFGVLAIAAVAAWQATLIPPSLYAQVGPAFFAWVAVGLLAIMGALLVRDAVTGGWSSNDDFGPVDLPGGAWTVLGLVLNLVAIEHLGFIIASTLMFTAVARGFASRQPHRDAAIGFLLATAAYIGFDRVLGYKIGSGLIERLF